MRPSYALIRRWRHGWQVRRQRQPEEQGYLEQQRERLVRSRLEVAAEQHDPGSRHKPALRAADGSLVLASERGRWSAEVVRSGTTGVKSWYL